MVLRGKVVAVTGASAGVGRASAEAFARAGANVALIARDSRRLDEARTDVERIGGNAIALPTDVADADAVERAAAEAEAQLGPIDVWVNNAMVSVFAPVKDLSPEDVRRVTEVAYLGYVNGTMSALRRMLPRNAGTIVQVGSALAYRAIPMQAAYCGAKHAIEGFTEALRCELMHDGSRVRTTVVHLPALNTPQFHWVKTAFDRHPQPVPPIFQPEVAALAIVHAARHPRREYWVGWPTARAILANRLVPGLLDRYLARRGVAAQQADWPIEPGREHNLYSSVDADLAARGEFGADARSSSAQLWLSQHRAAIAAAGSAAVAAGIAAVAVKSR